MSRYQSLRQVDADDAEKAIDEPPFPARRRAPSTSRWIAGAFALLLLALLLLHRWWAATREAMPLSAAERQQVCHSTGQRHEAVTTLLFNERYVPAVLTLGHTLKKHAKIGECRRQIALSLGHPASNGYSEEQLRLIELAGWEIREIPYIQDPPRIPARYRGVMSKLNIWNMTEYDAVMLLDGDTMVVGQLDTAFESFNRSGSELGGVRDTQPRFINAGVMLAKPDPGTTDTLIKAMQDTSKYDLRWPEQAFLSMHFKNRWHELPLGFNMYFFYHWLNHGKVAHLYKKARATASVIHFAGEVKPWTRCPPAPSRLPADFFSSVCAYDAGPRRETGTPMDTDLKLWASEFREFAGQVKLDVDQLAKGRTDYELQFQLRAILDEQW